MKVKPDFEERYRTGDLPWDTGRHDRHLEEIIIQYDIKPCKTLELGAGTGNDAIYLSKKGFMVTAVDISPTAIGIAKKRAEEEGIEIMFKVSDILKDEIPVGPYGFVYDRGCFHTFELSEERERFVDIIWKHLIPGGYWFSLIGSTDGPDIIHGPPRRSALEIVSAVEGRFEILLLKATHFDSRHPEPPRAWACLMRRRDKQR